MGKSVVRTRVDLRRESLRAQEGLTDAGARPAAESSASMPSPVVERPGEPLEAER
jgi:hypothetical protein